MVEQMEQVRVGIAEGGLISGCGQLVTTGLGSCVGLVLFDAQEDYAGMVHVMLPSTPKPNLAHPQKYADTAIPWLYERLLTAGAVASRLRAKYAGGAQMFRNLQTESLRIGDRNVEAIEGLLEVLHIPVLAREVGGSCGRTVRFSLPSRTFHIRTARGDEQQI